MPKRPLDQGELEAAFAALGAGLDWPSEVEIVIVGGAAMALTGLLPRRVTVDCDVALHAPREAWGALERAAAKVAAAQGLPIDWLNPETETLAHRMPDGWRDRATEIGRYGSIKLVALGRSDLIAMKFIAGRAVDLEDIRALRVTAEEGEFVRTYLRDLERKHPGREREQVRDALDLLEHGGFIR
jgi:hypothetical protein